MAYQHHQPCDTYFVESHDPTRAREDYIKAIGRRRQQAMADELSRQACETYIEDIVGHMKQMEVNSLGLRFQFLLANL